MYACKYIVQPITIIISILFLTLIPRNYAEEEDYAEYYRGCKKASIAYCGTVKVPEYPFCVDGIQPPYCGLEEFKLRCEDKELFTHFGSRIKFDVVYINQDSNTLELVLSDDSVEDICAIDTKVRSTILNETLFRYGNDTEVLHFFYNCSPEIFNNGVRENFTCSGYPNQKVIFGDEVFSEAQHGKLRSCKNISVPVRKKFPKISPVSPEDAVEQLQQLFHQSFEVQYYINQTACLDCTKSKGLCWRDTNLTETNTCLYKNGARSPPYQGNKKHLGLIIGLAGAASFSMLLLLLVTIIYCRRKRVKHGSSVVSRNVSSYSFSMSDSEKGGGNHMGVPIFSYSELEKATNNFDPNNELGDGGFGAVYKGKLQDGREVAVKRLYENSFKRVEQFMNEIAILEPLRHPNLVVLYGSSSPKCRKLLLVYEYIPNGTIADHLYGEEAKPGSLTWKTRMSIAVETASALSYLHAKEVIHRDVKTTNILLDNNFRVKVADFGLSRLFPMNVTHVSTAPQGTPGYVDPEYHQCYQLTSKSDVYSFGVVLIELISSLPAVDITRHRHEINLSNLAINKIEGNALHELVDPTLGYHSDIDVQNMITEVAELAFVCLQNEREQRPSMMEVHQVLTEIQNKYYGVKNEPEVDLPDDAFLLKNYPQNLSPKSVTTKWVSKSTNSSSSPQNLSPKSVTTKWVNKSTNSSSST